jgi:dihydrofolate reductase
MAFVFVHMTMSLDGYAAGPDVSVDEPMGIGGQRLHEWMFNPQPDEVDTRAIESAFADTGAVILGRTTFDVGLGEWNDTPYPAPSFVLTHRPRAQMPMKSGVFTFVDDASDALAQAKAAAGERGVSLMGVRVVQQFLNAGAVDEIRLQIAPIFLGQGLRLFDGVRPISLQKIDAAESRDVVHLRYRVASAD